MSNKLWKASVITTAIATATLLAGCGGSSNGYQSKEIKGVAVDFYLKNATVSFDDCNKTTQTDNQGKFSFVTTEDCQSSPITVTGGEDLVTGQPFSGTLKFKNTNLNNLDSIVISPLTSLEFYLDKTGQSSQLSVILANLGLNSAQISDVKTFDPAKSDAKTMAAVFILQQLATQIEDSLQAISKADGTNAFTEEQASELTFNAIISQLNNGKLFTNGSLTIDSSVLENTIEKARSEAVIALDDSEIEINASFVNQISTNITSVSGAINTVINTSPANLTAEAFTTELLNSPQLETIKDSLITPTYSDFKFASYKIANLKASTTALPLNLGHSDLLNNLSVSFKLKDSKSALQDTVKLGFKLDANRGNISEFLNVIIDKVVVEFNNQGEIISAKIPRNTLINFSSSLSGLNQGEISFAEDDIILSTNGSALTLANVVNSNAALNTEYQKYSSKTAVNDQLKATAYILPITYQIPNEILDLQKDTITVGNKNFLGTSIIGHFVLN